jgi:hypothetical protein
MRSEFEGARRLESESHKVANVESDDTGYRKPCETSHAQRHKWTGLRAVGSLGVLLGAAIHIASHGRHRSGCRRRHSHARANRRKHEPSQSKYDQKSPDQKQFHRLRLTQSDKLEQLFIAKL